MNEEQNTKLPVVETFNSIQGEGFNCGKAAYFIRLGGCDVCCTWCDEKIAWNSKQFPLIDINVLVEDLIKSKANTVVITGGEPFRYNLISLTDLIKKNNIKLMAETSGTESITGNWDWITMSPKKHLPPLKENYNLIDELKVVIQKPEDFKWAEINKNLCSDKTNFYLQAEWSNFAEIMPQIIDYVKQNPHWRLSVQTHKFLNIP